VRLSSAPLLLVATLTIGLSASPAVACSVGIPDDWGPYQFQQMAHDAVGDSTAIIDGEVIQPFIPGKQNAIVRAVRVLKGPPQIEFEVGEQDSCSIVLDHVGERSRMLLNGGPSVYYLQDDQSNARYEDSLLKSDRRKVWPYRAGKQQ
jgi:hypothetical protein